MVEKVATQLRTEINALTRCMFLIGLGTYAMTQYCTIQWRSQGGAQGARATPLATQTNQQLL